MRQLGLLQALFSGVCFGFLGVFGKWAYAAGLSAGAYLSLRFLLASVLLALYFLATDRSLFRISRGKLIAALSLGVLGYAVFSSCYFFALGGLPASLTVLLLYTYPVMVSLGARVCFGERLGLLHFLALPLVLVGLTLLTGAELKIQDPRYLLFGLGSGVFYAAYILASRRFLAGVRPLSSSFYIMLGAGIALSAVHLRALPTAPAAWAVVGATSLISTVLAISLFLAAIPKLSAVELSLFSVAEPVTGIALAGFFLSESFRPAQWLGAALILGALVLVAGARPRDSQNSIGPPA